MATSGGGGGINHPFDVSCKKKKEKERKNDFGLQMTVRKRLCRCERFSLKALETTSHLYPNSNVPLLSLLKAPLSLHCKNRPALKGRSVAWYVHFTASPSSPRLFSRL